MDAGGRAESDVDSLSVRTRAVAQYLKNQSPATQISKGQSGHLSLNRILEGKTRNQCARMFFETLVLKSYGFIDVQQEEACGDITLLLTPTLSKQNSEAIYASWHPFMLRGVPCILKKFQEVMGMLLT
ncbi:sister chromatid cohesion 1 protein 3-like [Magnolia sinica]|uniref:sister chromatid cohesion 1 protein 3-like n=1 Tax=Magnolia sinica TaxID=86752 RepID=UPI0026592865|nr:sister chromatid cohesion 1 protein 3-like [Magnolia sinica]